MSLKLLLLLYFVIACQGQSGMSMLCVLWVVNATVFDLVEDNGFYYIHTNIKGYKNVSLLLDTNTPIVLTTADSYEEEHAIMQSADQSRWLL